MATNVDLKAVEEFLRKNTYPKGIFKDKGEKSNFRKTCKNFSIVNGDLMYKEKRRVVFEVERRTAIIHDVHEGIGDNLMVKTLAAHRGRESTYQKISERFFWHDMIEDIKEYIKICKSCQEQVKIFKKISPELKSIPVPNEVMKQIGIDLCTFSEVDGFKHLIVCIDYFSKWSEAKAVKDKSAPTVANFLYEIICRHRCLRIQTNDQGKEFVNEVSENLHEMTGTEHRITSVYHPQSNGLCERQNRTIEDSLVKVLEEKPKEWPNIIDGILFAHRVNIHYSTKYSPFFLMFNRHPILPIDIKYDLIGNNADKEPESNPYDITTFQAVLESAALIREATNKKLVRISRRVKLSIKRTIIIATAQYQQHCLLDPRCSCRIKDDRIGKEENSHINGLDLTP